MPPWVGSGWRQISVAAAGRSAGCASSPTSVSPSEVTIVTSSRLAGSAVAALISVISSSPVRLRAGSWPPWATLPARVVPVPAFFRPWRVRGPDHQVGRARLQLLITAGTPVRLGRCRTGDLPDHPVTVWPLLQLRRPEPARRFIRLLRRRAGTASSAGLARRVRRQPPRLARAHENHLRHQLAGLTAAEPALAEPAPAVSLLAPKGTPVVACSASSGGGA